ncbi:MAG: hypothetical protein R3244_14150, partial [Thermoanaerobaculia bacterium]|nr:hypothetical protein [Thermoanaerobaculia bacterium]
GHLTAISTGDLLEEWPDEIDHMPSYYRGREADFWFYLRDIRRLVDTDTPGVIAELKKLRNRRYFDKPVSLYGGIVDLPLLVTREEEVSWFGGNEELTEGRLWAERDAVFKGETGRVAQDLRDNLFGPAIWEQLEPGSRTFLSTAEAVYRARREDPGFDFSAPAVEYAKAIETELNALLFEALHRALSGKPPHEREVRADGRLLDLGGYPPHQSLGTLKYLLDSKDAIVTTALRTVLKQDANWLLGTLPHRLAPIKKLRNPAAHGSSLTRSRLADMRAEILGIGQEGLLVRLARTKLRMGG